MRKRRFLAWLMTMVMAIGLMPATALADDSLDAAPAPVTSVSTAADSPIQITKRVSNNGDGTYKINMDAYVTGKVEQTAPTPMDIVLVLDVSGSMDQSIGSTAYSAVSSKNSTLYRYQEKYKYYYSADGETFYEVTSITRTSRDGTYTYTYKVSDSETRTFTSNGNIIPTNIYTKNVNQTKMEALITAVQGFIDATAEKNGAIKDTTKLNRVSIVKFACKETTTVDNSKYYCWEHGGEKHNYTQIVQNLTDVTASNKEAMKTLVSQLSADGATAADYGMNRAIAALKQSTDDRQKVVIMFTDGEPNHSSGFTESVANGAVTKANTLKNAGVLVYTIGMFKDADPTNTSTNNDNKFNAYLHAVSSNYPNATAWNRFGTGGSNVGYYKKASSAADVNNIFAEIADEIVPAIEAGSNSVLTDTVAANFDLSGISTEGGTVTGVTVQEVPATGSGAEVAWGRPVPYNATVTVNDNKVDVTGFNYAENYVHKDADTGNWAGKKLVFSFNIAPDPDATWAVGENKVPTNATAGMTYGEGNTESITLSQSPEVVITAYGVTYDANGGQNPPTDEKGYLSGTEATVLGAGSMTKAGYTFTGWNTEANGSGTPFAAGNEINMTANVTLYAQWTRTTYNVAVEYHYDSKTGATFTDPTTGQVNPFTVNVGDSWVVVVGTEGAANYKAPKTVMKGDVQYAFDPIESDALTGNAETIVKLVYSLDANKDKIPDKYQATVTFKVVNGTWSEGDNSPKTQVVTLLAQNANGYYVKDSVDVTAPTGMKANTGYGNGAWTNVTDGKVTVSAGQNVTATHTFEINKYNVTVNYLEEGTNDVLKTAVVKSNVEYNTEYDVSDDVDVTSLTKGGNTYTKVRVDGETAGTVTGNVVVTVYYSLDNWNDPGNSTTGGDRIPDKYQVLVRYQAGVGGKIAVGALEKEVITIPSGSGGVRVTKGDVTITGSTAVEDGSYFKEWTAVADKDEDWDISDDLANEGLALSPLTISAVGGTTYTFTANFVNQVSNVTKNVVTEENKIDIPDEIKNSIPAGMKITYPEVKDNVVQPIVCKVGDEINLLYAITVTGEEGSSFILTEEAGTIFVGATLEDKDLVRTYRAPSQYIGTLGGTEATLYFIKSFTITDDTEKLTNAVTVEGIDEPIEEEVPVQKMVCITFHPNLPLDLYTGEMDPQYVVPGEETHLDDNVYIAEGYKFLGWSEDRDAETATYKDGGSISVTEDTTLYAVWKADLSQKWLVTYLAGEGSGTAKNEWVEDGESITIADPTELGFTGPFDSEFSHWEVWYVDGEGKDEDEGSTTEKVPKNEFKIIGRTILTAIWEEEAPPEEQPIGLTYHANYDGSVETVTKEYLGTENLVVVKDEDIFANTPTGKKFLGWSKTENGPVVYQPDDEFYIWVDTDLYAQWKNVEDISVTKTIEGNHTGPFEFGDKVTFKIVVENNSGETWNDLLLVEKPGDGLVPVENPWSLDAAREFLMKLPIMLIPDFVEDIFDLDDESKVEEPKEDEPAVEESKAEEPVAEESKAEESKAEESVEEESVVEESKAEESVTEESKAEESKAEESVEEESVAEESVAEVPEEALAFEASVPDEPYLVETEDGLCVIIPELAPGDKIEFYYTVKVVDTREAYDPADYTNRVYIDGVEGAEDEVLVPVTGIEIEKSVEKNSKPEPGEWVIYEIVVTNTGAFDLTDVTVTEMPDDEYVDGYFCDENGKEDEDAVDATTYFIDELGAGEDVTLYYRAKVSSKAKDGDELLNDVTVTGTLDNDEKVTATDSNDDVIVEKESHGGIPSKDRPTKPSKVEEVLNTEDHFQYVQGYPDNTVGPERNITRAEATVIFFRLLNDSVRAEYLDAENAFPDVNMNDWFNLGVSTMENGGFVSGYDDGLFRPNANITRAELATIISNFDDLEPAAENKFADVEGHWAEKYINSAAEKGWLSGYEDGLFRPNQYITRAETMSMINRVLDRRVDADGLHAAAKQWKDNPESKWYYYAVLEATNYHEYERADVSDYENWTAIKAEKIWEN